MLAARWGACGRQRQGAEQEECAERLCCSWQKPDCRGPCTALFKPLTEVMSVEPVNGARSPEEKGGQAINRGRAARSAGRVATRWRHGTGRGEQGPMKKPSSGGLLSQQPESGA